MLTADPLDPKTHGVWALVGAAVSAGALKAFDRTFQRQDAEAKLAKTLREDLWTELKDLRNRLNGLDNELDEWKTKYYEIVAADITLKADMEKATTQLEALMAQNVVLAKVNEELQIQVALLQKIINPHRDWKDLGLEKKT